MNKSLELYSKNDICLFDNLKGFSILLIFAHHFMFTKFTITFLPIMIPLFAFSSGFAFKNSALLPYVKKAFIYYLVGNLIYMPWELWGMLKGHSVDLILLLVGPNSVILWYLPALIIWASCSKFLIDFKFPIASALALITLLHYVLALADFTGSSKVYWDFRIFGCLKTTVYMLFFFLLGVLIPWSRVIQVRRSQLKYLGLLFTIPLMIFLRVKNFQAMDAGWWQVPASLLVSFICTSTTMALFPGFKIPFLTEVGKASLNIYLLSMLLPFIFGEFIVHSVSEWNLRSRGDKIFIYAVSVPVLLGSSYLFSRRCVSLWLNAIMLKIHSLIFKETITNR